MAAVGTSTDRDELAVNKRRLKIRGSSALWTVPHGLVSELSSRRARVTLSSSAARPVEKRFTPPTAHLLLIFFSNLQVLMMRSQPWPPLAIQTGLRGGGGAEKGRTDTFPAGRGKALSAAPQGLMFLSPLLCQDRVTPGPPVTSDPAEDGLTFPALCTASGLPHK